MSGIDWGSADVVLACQLLTAGTLAVHLLVLRPRGAKQDLLLDARIVQDELDLAERLGQISANSVEAIATQQLLRRIRQNPRSAGLVLERIPELALAARASIGPTDIEYLGGGLDRLSDAVHRYLRGAWPRAGVLSATAASASTPVWSLAEPELDQNEPDPYNPADVLYLIEDKDLTDQKEPADDKEPAHHDPDEVEPAHSEIDSRDDKAVHDTADHDEEEDEDVFLDADEITVPPISEDDWAPSWVDLVRVETPRRSSGTGTADRHARPYRPALSTGHPSRRAEPVDRSSVLPR
jgi:hypothetical protein